MAVSSVERGRGPPPGVYNAPFFWSNVIDGRPPRRRTRGEGAYVVYHGLDVDVDTRITFATLVSVDPGENVQDTSDDILRVDDRVAVQKRTLLEMMDRERAFTDRVTARWNERLGQRLVRQRAFANRLRHPWAVWLAVRSNRLQARVGRWRIRVFRTVMRGLVTVPDSLVSRLLRVESHLSGRFGRRAMWAGLADPSKLNNEQKSVLLFLSTLALVTLVFVLNTVFSLILPQFGPVYQHAFTDATVSLLSTLAAPFPQEPLLIRGMVDPAIGPVIAFTGLFLGKIAGAWLLYFLGDSLYDAVDKATAKRPRMKRLVAWMHRNADRYGFYLLIPVNAVPFVPDVLIYVFALAGMRFKPYLAGIALGTALKFGAIIAAVYIMGPERVREFVGA